MNTAVCEVPDDPDDDDPRAPAIADATLIAHAHLAALLEVVKAAQRIGDLSDHHNLAKRTRRIRGTAMSGDHHRTATASAYGTRFICSCNVSGPLRSTVAQALDDAERHKSRAVARTGALASSPSSAACEIEEAS